MADVVSTASLVSRLAEFEAALTAVLTGKSYAINGRQLTRADERWITQQIEKLQSRIVTRTKRTSMAVVFNR